MQPQSDSLVLTACTSAADLRSPAATGHPLSNEVAVATAQLLLLTARCACASALVRRCAVCGGSLLTEAGPACAATARTSSSFLRQQHHLSAPAAAAEQPQHAPALRARQCPPPPPPPARPPSAHGAKGTPSYDHVTTGPAPRSRTDSTPRTVLHPDKRTAGDCPAGHAPRVPSLVRVGRHRVRVVCGGGWNEADTLEHWPGCTTTPAASVPRKPDQVRRAAPRGAVGRGTGAMRGVAAC